MTNQCVCLRDFQDWTGWREGVGGEEGGGADQTDGAVGAARVSNQWVAQF